MSHYFSPDPPPQERRRTISVKLWGETLDVVTASGVFSADGLDPGTAVLLRSCNPPLHATRLLDLGCGWGPLTLALARACPQAQIDAVDVNERALALCRDNATTHGVAGRVRATTPEDIDPASRYDEIWSNPPIRIGKAALQALLLEWLPRLAPGGVARLVVARHLGADPLQRWLTDQGHPCRRMASAKGFRVLVVAGPQTPAEDAPEGPDGT